MGKYRKKPVVIEAALYDGELVGEPIHGKNRVLLGTCPDWFPAVVRTVTVQPVDSLRENEVVEFDGGLWIGTLEGPHRASPGDMIIRGVKGELYPCKPDIFAATYEAAI